LTVWQHLYQLAQGSCASILVGNYLVGIIGLLQKEGSQTIDSQNHYWLCEQYVLAATIGVGTV
jgi:hypothetical protein